MDLMNAQQSTFVQCKCGAVEVHINSEPMAQYYCHCDDCQNVHGGAYAVSLGVLACGRRASGSGRHA